MRTAAVGRNVSGVEILTQESGISIGDAVSEVQTTFVARALDPKQPAPSTSDGYRPSDDNVPSARAGEAPATELMRCSAPQFAWPS
jgi:hypothetical protein